MGTFHPPCVGSRRQPVAAAGSGRPGGAAVASNSQPLNEDSYMHQHFWKPSLLALTAFAMTALTPALVGAQDRPDERRPDEHQVMKSDEHRDEHNRDAARGDDQA